jgi:hypothetical protein
MMKRKVEITPQRVLNDILEVLRARCPRLTKDTWQPLGTPLKRCLQDLGTEAGLRVYAAHPTGEYVWDVAWVHEAKDEYWVDMAAEIELSDMTRASVLDDFYKVLDAKARLKVFITAVTQKMAKDLRTDVAWAVRHQRFRLPDERLIAVLVTYDGRKKIYNAAVRIFDGSGPIGAWSERWKDEPLGHAD